MATLLKPSAFQDGDIVLVKVNNFKAWYRYVFAHLIRFFDGVYYHHAQIYFGGWLWEANNTVVAQGLDYNNGDEVIILRLKKPLNRFEYEKLHDALLKMNGKRYDYWGAMLHQLIYILTFRRIWIGKRGTRADSNPYCTEFVTSLMHQLRGYFPEHYKIGPAKLLQNAPLYYEVVKEGVYSYPNEV